MNQQSLNIVQISDTHLFADHQGAIAGRNTWDSFLAVKALVEAHHPNPDMILFTGDISQDYSDESYHHLANAMKNFTCPIYWIPGNHDYADQMARVLSQTAFSAEKSILSDAWHIVLLDTAVKGKVQGQLAESEWERLNQAVSQHPDKNLMIAIHHHPVSIDSVWLNGIGLEEADRFLEIAKQHPKLRMIIWGHIHQAFEAKHGETHLLSAPSTCIQFLPKATQFTLDTALPGYRWFELSEDGSFTTGVNRLTDFKDGIDYSSSGY